MKAQSTAAIDGNRLRLAAVLCCVALLSACGFQLRGSGAISPLLEQTFVSGGDNRELFYELESALYAAGARVVSSAEGASAVLTLERQRFERRVISVDTQGRAAEYELALLVEYSLRDRAGSRLADRERLSVIRDYSFDPDSVLAKDDEEQALKTDMARQAAQQILRRLQGLGRQRQ